MYKNIIDKSLTHLHSYKPICCKENPSGVLHFNGNNYFIITPEFSDYNTMELIDSVFFNSKLFSSISPS